MGREIPKMTLAQLREELPNLAVFFDDILKEYLEADKDFLRGLIKGTGYEGTLEIIEKLVDIGWLKMMVEEKDDGAMRFWLAAYNPLTDEYESALTD